MDGTAKQCAAYFRKKPGYERIMRAFRKKYEGLGRVGGAIVLSDADEAECTAARELFGTAFYPPLVIKLSAFEQALQSTVFQGVTLPELLEAYYREPIHTRQCIRQQHSDEYREEICAAKAASTGSCSQRWLNQLELASGHGATLLKQTPPEIAGVALLKACAALDWLEAHPGEAVRLAVLSAKATSDPHALDAGTVAGKLFLHAIAYSLRADVPQTAEQKAELYYRINIICDSISSVVSQIGLMLWSNGEEHPGFAAFRLRRESCLLSLTNLAGLTGASSPTKRVYLVENQMVFSQLCDHGSAFHSPLLCTSGQLQVASLRLLDLLAAANTHFYYSGDFDGEGLGIAYRLAKRYPERFSYWHMSPEDYERCRSDKPLSNDRLRLLDGLEGSELARTAEAIRLSGRAGYQELLLPELANDLTNEQA
ncbi:MAG: TIGR02679 family protein [Eubacteriales bacterium]|nr:TIGR02679 family protein [Eubacteriales bacterium]